jgi:hypothetical protein
MSDDPRKIISVTQQSSSVASLTTMGVTLGQFKVAVSAPGTYKPSIVVAPANHAIYSLVRRAASAWAHLEHTLDLIIWDLIGLEPIPKVVDSDESFVIRYAASESSTGGCRDVET